SQGSDDFLGASLKLAFLSNATVGSVPSAYAEALFDDYALRFEDALVNKLDYSAPEYMAELLSTNSNLKHFAKVIDLGCGTGLMGAKVRGQTGQLIGVDISSAMLEQAKAKQLYDHLIKADLTNALAEFSNINMAMAADVLMYLADIEPVFTATSKALASNGLFLFCVELHDGPEPWKLRKTMRHAHSSNYIDSLLDDNNFKLLARRQAMIRKDEGQPVNGLYCLAQKAM
ncbi:MAG: class I SAM-dependent DNA methyltransferase, partial [Rhizobiaceae bacterium]